ncbi:hypothetical protein Gpo141_00005644 [Globisporangium polare]
MKLPCTPLLSLALLALSLNSVAATSHGQQQQATNTTSTTGLSIPNLVSQQVQHARAAEIHALASQIANEKRTWRIGGVEYPFYDGPVARPGSLAATIKQEQVNTLDTFDNTNSTALYQILLSSNFSTEDDYQTFYGKSTKWLPKPISTDISDESFGYQRTTIKGFNMRAFNAKTDSYPSDPSLTSGANIAKICGAKRTSLGSLATGNALYVSDFSDFAKWSLSSATGKYVAPVIAYFCYNENRKLLLPLAIRIVDTSLTYTPFDKPDEWKLAKMAVDAAEISFQQMQHLAESHAVLLPVRIETLRNLASTHPVSALMLRVSSIDFGIEQLAANLLFNTSTALDYTFGFGAVGCIEFLAHQMQSSSIQNTFEADIKSRGLKHLPNHKYAKYGQLYFDAIEKTMKTYLDVYYPSDTAVREDTELQNWAKGCAAVAQLKDFPSRFISVSALQKVLTHLIFQTTVHHHAMNGAVSWQSVSAPYSTPALWKKLPTAKLAANETLNVLEYSTPKQFLPLIVILAFRFDRYVPDYESLFSLFSVSPFTEEPKMAGVTSDFSKSLQAIDAFMVAAEQSEKWPYKILRPSMLAFNGWV